MPHYHCLACGQTAEREEGEPLPAGDEYCSHQFELTTVTVTLSLDQAALLRSLLSLMIIKDEIHGHTDSEMFARGIDSVLRIAQKERS